MNAEILAPAGDEQSARVALNAGADAVYLGLTQFSARAGAENFNASALQNTVQYAHLLGAKVYVCLNTLVKDGEADGFFQSALSAWNAGADALLIQDLFLGKRLKELYPEMVLHLSTQGGCCNVYGAKIAKAFGFSRVVLARETPVEEIAKISSVIETEAFVQGALCTAFSGQCYFSSFAGNNSGNRGRCKQPCRKKYSLDRAGFEGYSYALSTSDLCAGRRVKELIAAGVSSLKIEGRLRRKEYCAAAVGYYKTLLGGGDSRAAFSLLKRAYNRGDYTEGLAFGQQRDFLSRKVQGHIGEEVGTLAFLGKAPFCKSDFSARKGDCFKILRLGEETGSATFLSAGKGGFFLSVSGRVRAGDSVRVTTDTAAGERVLSQIYLKPVFIELTFTAGEKPRARCGAFEWTGETALDFAKSSPLTQAEMVACFCKTDGLPLTPSVTANTQNAFCPKSVLNGYRREFYARLAEYLAPRRKMLAPKPLPNVSFAIGGERERAVITENLADEGVLVYKPRDYARLPKENTQNAYLYLPPFLTSGEIEKLRPAVQNFRGIYCDGYYGFALAEEWNKELFAGTGCNLTNRFAVEEAQKRAKRFALSKELSSREQEALAVQGAFALQRGGVKLMDLIYCPFDRTCKTCDRREYYTLTDEEGRAFPLRRYEVFGACRYEVYNCAPLSCEATISRLTDETAGEGLRGKTATHGHERGSML